MFQVSRLTSIRESGAGPRLVDPHLEFQRDWVGHPHRSHLAGNDLNHPSVLCQYKYIIYLCDYGVGHPLYTPIFTFCWHQNHVPMMFPLTVILCQSVIPFIVVYPNVDGNVRDDYLDTLRLILGEHRSLCLGPSTDLYFTTFCMISFNHSPSIFHSLIHPVHDLHVVRVVRDTMI